MEVKGNFIVQGSYIDIHDNEVVNLSVDKAEVRVNGDNIKTIDDEDVKEFIAEVSPENLMLPDVLNTIEAKTLCYKLNCAGIMNERWLTKNLSNAEKGTLADFIAEKLSIQNKWKFFGNLWNMDSETLRTACARGLNQEKTWNFRKILNDL